MKRLLIAIALALGLAFHADAQTGSKIVTNATTAGQTGAMQSGTDTSSVAITFCGTGYSGVLYVDTGSVSTSLTQAWTTTLTTNSDCTTIYTEIPASKWHRVRWTLTAGTLNVWMTMTRQETTASYATMNPPTSATLGCVGVFLGSPLNLQCAPAYGMVYSTTTKSLDVTDGRVQAGNLKAIGLGTPGAITVTNQGTPGTTTVTYTLLACYADGSCTEAGANSTTTTSAATLSGTDFNRLTWSSVSGSALYKVRREVAPTSPATTGVIWSGTALTVDDTGLAGDGTAKPTVDETGTVTADHAAIGDGTIASRILIPNSAATAPGIGGSSQAGTGFALLGNNYPAITAGGTAMAGVGGAGGWALYYGMPLGFNPGGTLGAEDLYLYPDPADTPAQKRGDNDQKQRVYGAKSAYIERGAISELLTLDTGSTGTVTAGNLAPANSRILSIVYRVTTAITTAASFTVKVTGGNPFVNVGTATTSQTGVALGSMGSLVPALYADQFNAYAATLTVTTNANPGAGAIRFTVFYEIAVPGSS